MKLNISIKSLNLMHLSIFILTLLFFILNRDKQIFSGLLFLYVILLLISFFTLKKKHLIFRKNTKVINQIKKVYELLFIEIKIENNSYLFEKYNFETKVIDLKVFTIICFYYKKKNNLEKKTYLENTILKYSKENC